MWSTSNIGEALWSTGVLTGEVVWNAGDTNDVVCCVGDTSGRAI